MSSRRLKENPATGLHEKLPADVIGHIVFYYIDFSFINTYVIMIFHYCRISDPWEKTILNPILIKRFIVELLAGWQSESQISDCHKDSVKVSHREKAHSI